MDEWLSNLTKKIVKNRELREQIEPLVAVALNGLGEKIKSDIEELKADVPDAEKLFEVTIGRHFIRLLVNDDANNYREFKYVSSNCTLVLRDNFSNVIETFEAVVKAENGVRFVRDGKYHVSHSEFSRLLLEPLVRRVFNV